MNFMRDLYLSIRWKLLLPFLGIVLLVLAVLLPAATARINRAVEAEADRRLARSAESIAAYIENSEQQARLSASFVANLPEIGASSEDPEELAALLTPRRFELDVQELSYYDAGFAPGDLPIHYGGPVSTRRFQASQSIEDTIARLVQDSSAFGVPGSAVALAPQGSRIIGVSPVRDEADTITGVVLVALYIDDAYAGEIADILNVDVVIISENAVSAASLDPASGYQRRMQEDLLLPENRGRGVTLEYDVNDQVVQKRLLPVSLTSGERELGVLLVAESTSELIALRAQVQTVIVALALVITLFAVVVGIGISANMTRPLQALADTTRRVAGGDFDHTLDTAPTFTRDEITDLYADFNQMIDQLEGLYTDLEGQVQERTTELEQAMQDLEAARDEALEASRTKSAFLATMSHELRTPLNAIIGYTQMMAGGITGPMNEKQADYTERVLRNGQHLLLLINDILDLAKIEAGRMEIVDAPFDLRAWAEDTGKQVRGLADEKGIEFRMEIDEALPDVIVADADRLRQIALNLLSNAIKFTRVGHVDYTLKVAPDDRWQIVVTDTGIGIPSHKQETIFDEFSQVDNSSRREFGGTGLGLSIVRNLCLMMDGSARVSSTVNEGSTFTVTLPLKPGKLPRKA